MLGQVVTDLPYLGPIYITLHFGLMFWGPTETKFISSL